MKTRRLLSLMLVVLMFTSLTLVFGANLANAQGDTYTVQYGDNLTSIASRFGVSVQALAQANGIANVNNIYAGQVLKLPTAATSTTAPTTPTTTGQQAYIVQPGDSLTSVAAHFGVGIYDLAALNHLSVMSYLYVGQNLAIPVPSGPSVPAPANTTTAAPTTTDAPTPTPKPITTVAPTTGSQTTYVVQSGDTLSAIATRFHSTVSALVTLNHIADPSMISVGQTLVIPAAGSGNATGSGAVPTPTEPPASHPIGTGKWIDVNLTTQKMVAYEGSTPVYSSLVSTGVAAHPTVTGTFNIYVKYTSQAMSGGTPGVDYYYLPGVPYVMYFYQSYALHGTYWHHNFGHVMSHGCVNLPTPVAEWLFNWAPVGTPVNIHY